MKHVLIGGVVLIGILGAAAFWWLRQPTDRVVEAFAQSDCPESTMEPLEPTAYTGPLIDTHIHIPHVPEGPAIAIDGRPSLGVNVTIPDYVCMMDVEGVTKVFAFFPVWDPIIEPSIEVVERAMAQYPGRFVPFIMPPDHDDDPDGFPTVTADVLASMLGRAPGLFKGYGEIGLYARGDHGGPKGAPALFPNAPRMQAIYPVVREHRLLVYVHLGEGQQAAFEEVLSANPDITFIWHGDQLIPTTDRRLDLTAVEEILTNHSNVRYGVDELYGGEFLLKPEMSKAKFLAHFADPDPLLDIDVATWKAFIERHPDQVLYGTDRGWSAAWSVDPDVAQTLTAYNRAFIGRLDPSVQEKIAYRNAEALLAQ
ncbi:amidohydrolase family protein [Candidatus Berkelbacteria bacterium]|nr:amidohydrolase family protein [Candidatus Berkelbacteria bacterium]